MGGFPSGQWGQTVNLLSYDFDGSNPSPPTIVIIPKNLVKSRFLGIFMFRRDMGSKNTFGL